MKIVFLASRFPFPLDKGDKLRAFHHIKELSRDHEIHLIAINDKPVDDADKDEISSYCKSIDIQILSDSQRYYNVVKGILSSMPMQVQYFYDKGISRHISMLIDEIQPDHIFAQLIRMAPYVKSMSYPKSIDYMDSISLNMSELGLNQIKYLPLFNSIERKKIKSYEFELFDRFNHHFIISERDRDEFDPTINDKITILSNGVDSDYFKPLAGVKKDFDVVFCGNLGYVHNDKAAHYLIDKIAQRMRPDIFFLIAGSRPSKWLNIKQRTNIRVAGWTEDLRTHYQRSKMLVAPIFTGSGQQNKILEAMAQGIPCITTSFVNESIGASPDEEILIADNPKKIMGYIESLIANEALRSRLSTAGRKFVEERYSWRRSAQLITDKIKSA